MRLPRRTLYTILVQYMQQYGHLSLSKDQLRYALLDLNEIIDFAMYKMDTVIDADAAKRISEVGLQWVSFASLYPDKKDEFAKQAQDKLESPQ